MLPVSKASTRPARNAQGWQHSSRVQAHRLEYVHVHQPSSRIGSRLRHKQFRPTRCDSSPATNATARERCGARAGSAVKATDTPVDVEAYGKDANYDALADSIRELSEDVRERLGGTSVYLVGMMGSGKSTVGKLLAAALEYYFFDSDSLVEAHTQSSVQEIFEEEGEDAFREVETAVLQELAPFRDCIVATGGGAVTRRVNWGHMSHAVSVFLDGAPALLAARLVADGIESRPLVAAQEEDESGTEYDRTVKRLEGMMDERAKHYHVADMRVSLSQTPDAGDPNIGAAAAVVTYRILAQLKQRLVEKAEELEEKRLSTVTVSDNTSAATSPEE